MFGLKKISNLNTFLIQSFKPMMNYSSTNSQRFFVVNYRYIEDMKNKNGKCSFKAPIYFGS